LRERDGERERQKKIRMIPKEVEKLVLASEMTFGLKKGISLSVISLSICLSVSLSLLLFLSVSLSPPSVSLSVSDRLD
jgi:hypothetical protein